MKKRVDNALIMAAGRGQRMMPLTADLPKPMAPFNGTTLIAKGIENLRAHIKYIHITVGYKGAMLADHVISHGVATVINTEGQSNSWWIYNTLLRHLNEPMFVLTCDNVVELDFDLLIEDYLRNGSPACMVVPVPPVEGLEGDYIFYKNNVVMGIDRSKRSDVYCSGIQVVNPYRINELTDPMQSRDFYSVWHQLILKEQMYCSRVYPKKWMSIDTVSQLTSLNKILER
ncbi:NDP-sugar synthase [bacterium]|nr:MAG: NDP-sugar synthase [bacterium]